MDCKNHWRKIVSLTLTLIISLFALNSFGQKVQPNKSKIEPCSPLTQGGGLSEQGNGLSEQNYRSSEKIVEPKPKKYPDGTKPLRIVSKPRAYYTNEAESKCVTGTVLLKITFSADGKVGKIKVLKGLDYGLSEQAITAAKQIKFEPALKNGKATTVTKKVTYNFTIY